MSRRTMTIAAVTLVVLLVAWKSVYIVRPDQVVVVTKFGDPIGEKTDPGLHFLIPFVEEARYLDSRVRGWDDVARNTNTAELKPIDFTVFARWQIDPTQSRPGLPRMMRRRPLRKCHRRRLRLRPEDAGLRCGFSRLR